MENERREVRKVGLVLSGGLARGVAQLAFCQEIVNKIGMERLGFCSGSSIGALNAYSLASGTGANLLDYYLSLEIGSLGQFRRALKNNLFGKAVRTAEGTPLSIPTYVSATRLLPIDLYYFCLTGMNRNDLTKVLNLSMAFPVLNGPRMFKGRLFLDGGATNNVPILPADYYDLDLIVIVHCYPKYYPPEEELRKDRILIDVDCTLGLGKGITPFSYDKTSIREMAAEGSRAGKEFADFIFSDFDYQNVRQRCFDYTNGKIPERREKSAGMLAVVDYANAIFSFKQ